MPRLTPVEVRATLAAMEPATPRDNVLFLAPSGATTHPHPSLTDGPHPSAGEAPAIPEGEDAQRGGPLAAPPSGIVPFKPLTQAQRDLAHMVGGYVLGGGMTLLGTIAALPPGDALTPAFEGLAIGMLAISVPVLAALAAERWMP